MKAKGVYDPNFNKCYSNKPQAPACPGKEVRDTLGFCQDIENGNSVPWSGIARSDEECILISLC